MAAADSSVVPDLPPDLDALTGMRSSKPTFYAEYRRTAESMARSVHALDRISRVLVATGLGPHRLCHEVVQATAEHLGAQTVVLALADGALPDAAPRFVAAGPAGVLGDPDRLPAGLAAQVSDLLGADSGMLVDDDERIVVPLLIGDERQGVLALWLAQEADQPGLRAGRLPVPDGDLAVVRILANQALSALQSSDLLRRSEQLRARSDRLYSSAAEQAQTLAERNEALQEAQQRLTAARLRQDLDAERHRLARELHDSVAQHVLSAGMAIEWCRGEVAEGSAVRERLDTAKDLARTAVDRLRSAIFALSSEEQDTDQGLPEMLQGLRRMHDRARFDVRVRVEGVPVRLASAVERSLFQAASECVFNAAVHAHATRAQVRLTYTAERLRLAVSDDGDGEPEVLRRVVRGQVPGTGAGYHRGLANMRDRARELDGELAFTRSRMGGVRVRLTIPLSAAPSLPPPTIEGNRRR